MFVRVYSCFLASISGSSATNKKPYDSQDNTTQYLHLPNASENAACVGVFACPPGNLLERRSGAELVLHAEQRCPQLSTFRGRYLRQAPLANRSRRLHAVAGRSRYFLDRHPVFSDSTASTPYSRFRVWQYVARQLCSTHNPRRLHIGALTYTYRVVYCTLSTACELYGHAILRHAR